MMTSFLMNGMRRVSGVMKLRTGWKMKNKERKKLPKEKVTVKRDLLNIRARETTKTKN